MATSHALAEYHRRRDFAHTAEPRGALARSAERLSFVVQKHAARSLHYDFRLELDGTLKSWAVPKGPSLDPSVKRMAVQVEDHPLAYAGFEGTIPPKHYGAGTVIVWDRGVWSPVGDARKGLRDGHLKFDLDGAKLRGRWALVRMKPRDGERQPSWLLMKERDDAARDADAFDVLTAEPDSVITKPPAALPPALAPQLATLVDSIPPGDDWLYEIKFDGYRLLTRVDGHSVQCFTRNGNDWSSRLAPLLDVIRALKLAPCWLDGELVVLDANGVPDFQALQNAFDAKRTGALRYFVFDLPFHAGEDLRSQPLVARRERLRTLIPAPPDSPIRFSDAFAGDPAELLASARAAGARRLGADRLERARAGRRRRALEPAQHRRPIGARQRAVGRVRILAAIACEGDEGARLQTRGGLMMIQFDHIEPPTVPDTNPNRPPPMPPAPAPDVVPVRDPMRPEHPDPVKEPPTHEPPISTSARRAGSSRASASARASANPCSDIGPVRQTSISRRGRSICSASRCAWSARTRDEARHAGYRKMAEHGRMVAKSFELSDVEIVFPSHVTAILS